MTRFHIVRSPSQIETVVRLAREIWIEHYVPIIGREQVAYMLEKFQSAKALASQIDGEYDYYLAARDGRSVGYLAVVPDVPDATLLLSKIYVLSSERGHGVGKAMLQFVEDLCRQRAIRTIWLTVNRNNAESIAWYARMGFSKTGPLFQEIGGGFAMDDFRMEKAID